MEYLPDMETLTHWIVHHGPYVLFILLALGIIALPVPEESLMVVTGVLMHQGVLPIPSTFIAALGGSICGITVSYLLGRTLGLFFLHKYGKWIGVKEEHITKVHIWFERFGKWALLVGYFIPGVRHFTGFTAGASYLEFHLFALFAYTGALLWVTLFLSIGYFFGNYWVPMLAFAERHIEIAAAIVALLALSFLIYKWNKKPA